MFKINELMKFGSKKMHKLCVVLCVVCAVLCCLCAVLGLLYGTLGLLYAVLGVLCAVLGLLCVVLRRIRATFAKMCAFLLRSEKLKNEIDDES